jgi:hypothetical protein
MLAAMLSLGLDASTTESTRSDTVIEGTEGWKVVRDVSVDVEESVRSIVIAPIDCEYDGDEDCDDNCEGIPDLLPFCATWL